MSEKEVKDKLRKLNFPEVEINKIKNETDARKVATGLLKKA